MYGTAEPLETVTITGLDRRSSPGVPYPVMTDARGHWKVQLDPYQDNPAHTPQLHNVTISGSVSTNVIHIKDVTYGDVILCSGQSNMNKPLSYVFNASAEIAASVNFPNVRLFSVPGGSRPNCNGEHARVVGRGASCGPATNYSDPQCGVNPHTGQVHCEWVKVSPSTVKDFSAVCYLTAKDLILLHSPLQNRSIGLIQAAVDGTSVEEWMPPAALDLCPIHPTAIRQRSSQVGSC